MTSGLWMTFAAASLAWAELPPPGTTDKSAIIRAVEAARAPLDRIECVATTNKERPPQAGRFFRRDFEYRCRYDANGDYQFALPPSPAGASWNETRSGARVVRTDQEALFGQTHAYARTVVPAQTADYPPWNEPREAPPRLVGGAFSVDLVPSLLALLKSPRPRALVLPPEQVDGRDCLVVRVDMELADVAHYRQSQRYWVDLGRNAVVLRRVAFLHDVESGRIDVVPREFPTPDGRRAWLAIESEETQSFWVVKGGSGTPFRLHHRIDPASVVINGKIRPDLLEVPGQFPPRLSRAGG